MYNATIYINTGFNSMNSPDRVSLLETAAQSKVTVPALDLYQIQELDQVRINVSSYASIRDADYMLLVNDQDATDFGFYSIEDIQMTDMHTAVVSIIINPTLTVVGTTGLSMLEFTDGICARHHVATDTFGEYCEEDPYMTPSEMMKIETEDVNFDVDGDGDSEYVFLVTTADMYNVWEQFNKPQTAGSAPFALDYQTASRDSVVVPYVPSAKIMTKAVMEMGVTAPLKTVMSNMTVINATKPLVTLSDNNDWLFPSPTNPYDGLGIVRALALESSIIAQYTIPFYMIKHSTFIDSNTYGSDAGHGIVGELVGTRALVELDDLTFMKPYNTAIHNNRIFYGDTAKYTIVSIASGNQASFLPEEIYRNYPKPEIEMRVDPRPNGCPYFRFKWYRQSDDPTLFFANAVRGLQWQNVPITYELASGSLLNEYEYNAKKAVREEEFVYNMNQNNSSRISGKIDALIGGISQILGSNYDTRPAYESDWMTPAQMNSAANPSMRSPISAATNIGSAVMKSAANWGKTNASANNMKSHLEAAFNIEANKEKQALLLSNYTVAPSMYFPISEGIRDYVGNKCIVYRYRYTDRDVARIDKILTMYGYKHTTSIEPTLLTNRPKFNYIEAEGVSIKNAGVPKWLRDAVTAQFSSGVRFWHVPIDINAYTDGSNDLT